MQVLKVSINCLVKRLAIQPLAAETVGTKRTAWMPSLQTNLSIVGTQSIASTLKTLSSITLLGDALPFLGAYPV
jgi:hypothetical protein